MSTDFLKSLRHSNSFYFLQNPAVKLFHLSEESTENETARIVSFSI